MLQLAGLGLTKMNPASVSMRHLNANLDLNKYCPKKLLGGPSMDGPPSDERITKRVGV
jgi:hypothetical protein